jgi:hypothetical protein
MRLKRLKKLYCYTDCVPVELALKHYLPGGLRYQYALKRIRAIPNIDYVSFRHDFMKRLGAPHAVQPPENRLSEYISGSSELENDRELSAAIICATFGYLGIKDFPGTDFKTSADAKNCLRGYLFVYYKLAKALETVLGKKEALNLYCSIVDEETKMTAAKFTKREKVTDAFMESDTRKGTFKGAFNVIEFITDDARFGEKVTRCKWAEVLSELKDPDFAYAVACHFDFEAVRAYNENFELTRNGTLAKGKPYCDFMYHDKRLSQKLEHPPEEFWDNLETLPER